jgi:hypothetical protein
MAAPSEEQRQLVLMCLNNLKQACAGGTHSVAHTLSCARQSGRISQLQHKTLIRACSSRPARPDSRAAGEAIAPSSPLWSIATGTDAAAIQDAVVAYTRRMLVGGARAAVCGERCIARADAGHGRAHERGRATPAAQGRLGRAVHPQDHGRACAAHGGAGTAALRAPPRSAHAARQRESDLRE